MLARAAVATAGLVAAPALGAVPKTNPTPVYFHYMPWFETPATNGGDWGYHWRMFNRDPDVVDPSGRRQISSHYYPKIGPYASGDPHVLEYHMLLMKLSGVDGVFLDWYGTAGSNGDIAGLLANSDAIVDATADFGLDVAVVLEDRFARSADDVRANVAYLRNRYFGRDHYVRVGPANEPLLMAFGPIGVQDPSAWPGILDAAGEPVEFLPLWYKSPLAGAAADGEHAWIFEDEAQDDHLDRQQAFLETDAPGLDRAIGVAYPGFDDFYLEGGVGDIIGFEIPHDAGEALRQTLSLNETFVDNIDAVQLATFNDFGEGTMFEPTIEFGYDYLLEVQRFTGVPFGEAELHLAFELFSLRQAFGDDPAKAASLDAASEAIRSLDFDQARSLLDLVAGIRGDADGDGDVDLADFGLLRANFGRSVADFSRGDFDLDGKVDLADFGLLRANFGSREQAAALMIPEPTSATAIGLLAVTSLRRRRHDAVRDA